SDEAFNKWYNTQHIRDIFKAGYATLALRYQTWPYLAVYNLPDIHFLKDPSYKDKLPVTSDLFPEKGKEVHEWVDFDTRFYTPIQTFEPPRNAKKTSRPKIVFTVHFEPGNGKEGEREFDEWYRKQHLDMLSMLPNYRRSIIYKAVNNAKPRFLVIHEMDSAELDPHLMGVLMNTEWAKKILGEAESFEMAGWEMSFGRGR
ncbi:hypothetical protein K469DRAFT_572794, partial [Zopfia rhizophila CBS 207.26]